jgi:hypothetical protein
MKKAGDQKMKTNNNSHELAIWVLLEFRNHRIDGVEHLGCEVLVNSHLCDNNKRYQKPVQSRS